MPSADFTPRAYTLRLAGADHDDQGWRDVLWQTHTAVNAGAMVFGDWLLTLRGGLSHEMADAPIRFRGGAERPPSPDVVAQRRVLLALSWLSVESGEGAPADLILPDAADAPVEALRQVLTQRGLADNEVQEWVKACGRTLGARIRKDAVWVNRSAAFCAATTRLGESLDCEEAWDLLWRFFGTDLGSAQRRYLEPPPLPEQNQGSEEDQSQDTEASAEEQVLNLVQPAGKWLSQRFGTGEGGDHQALAEAWGQVASWAGNALPGEIWARALEQLDRDLGGSGHPDAALARLTGVGAPNAAIRFLKGRHPAEATTSEELGRLESLAIKQKRREHSQIGAKGSRPYAEAILADVKKACGFSYRLATGSNHKLYSVMLDHAARRIVQQWSWVKNAEARRQKAEADARAIDKVPAEAMDLLEAYRAERAPTLGALGDYRIQRGAVDGWEHVLRRWEKCADKEARVKAARDTQDEVEKFGDIQLFEALAQDDFLPVWRRDGAAKPSILRDYVRGTGALADQTRFKVPAFRHPHALLHPVYCDFGDSRPGIAYAAHQAAGGTTKRLKSTVSPARQVTLELWNGREVHDVALRWESKRFWNDMGMQHLEAADAGRAPRSTRFGKAAASTSGAVLPIQVYEDKDWNGRLQAPRPELERLARHVQKNGWDARAHKLKNSLAWSLTCSVRLRPAGPWHSFALGRDLKSTRRPHSEENAKRGLRAKLRLARLPGLRVLSVDLGHRYAAACTVWETITAEQMAEAIRAAGRAAPRAGNVYCHLPKAAQGLTVYRRIGPDTLPSGAPHPAPWARLERQFLVKLQGEDRNPRPAEPQEIEHVRRFAAWLGLAAASDQESFREWRRRHDARHIDDFLAETLHLARLGLRRHADRARIAFAFACDYMPRPGGEKYFWEPGKDRWMDDAAMRRHERLRWLAAALASWHELSAGGEWKDDAAARLWNEVLRPLGAPALEHPQGDEHRRPKEQKKQLEREMEGLAKTLLDNAALSDQLARAWTRRWKDADDPSQPSGWRSHLRWLRDWVLPKGEQGKGRLARNVGGLKLERIASIQALYRLQKAFKNRPFPDNLRAGVPLDDEGSGFGAHILRDLEEMRLNRVKQLASRIVEAALGVGAEQSRIGGRMPRRPATPVYQVCHAIVVEDLKHYRPEQTRTRRENRQLMTWSSSKVAKYLDESCKLHGLRLEHVWPGYTSRQDSRTGAPGVRCTEVSVADFVRKDGRYLARAQTAEGESAEVRYLRGLAARWEESSSRWTDPQGAWRLSAEGKWTAPPGAMTRNGAPPESPAPLLLPERGGELFVSAAQTSGKAKHIAKSLAYFPLETLVGGSGDALRAAD